MRGLAIVLLVGMVARADDGKPIVSHTRDITIPFVIEPANRGHIDHLTLLVSSDEGKTGWVPEKSHAAIASVCSEDSGCGAGGLIAAPEFNSATMSGALHVQSRRRSSPIAACVAAINSGHRPVNTAARNTSIPSAFSSRQ
jgi:hypothetical protein